LRVLGICPRTEAISRRRAAKLGGLPLLGRTALFWVGSLRLSTARTGARDLNHGRTIDLLKPILENLLTLGMRTGRLDLGLVSYATSQRRCVSGCLSQPRSGAKGRFAAGDVVLPVAGAEVNGLPASLRTFGALGRAGVAVPLTLTATAAP